MWTLETLPVEVQQTIFEYLTPGDRVRLQLVSKTISSSSEYGRVADHAFVGQTRQIP
jgi:hypothetical protein